MIVAFNFYISRSGNELNVLKLPLKRCNWLRNLQIGYELIFKFLIIISLYLALKLCFSQFSIFKFIIFEFNFGGWNF